MAIRPRAEVERLTPAVHGGLNHAELESLGRQPSEIFDFSISINPLGPTEATLQSTAAVNVLQYPDPEATAFRRAAAAQLGVPAENIIAGNGSSELIWQLALAYLRPGDKVVIVGPTYGEYEVAARLMGAEVLTVRAEARDGFEPDIGAIIRLVTEQNPRLTFLCNPNNPTGFYTSEMAVEKIMAAQQDGLLVLDEAYVHFVANRWSSPARALGGNLVVLRSLTKDYALVAYRLGYAIAQTDVIDALRRVRPSWNVNALALAAGTVAIADENHLLRGRIAAQQARSFLQAGLRERGLNPLPSPANFMLVEVGDATAFRARLLAKGVQVRDCTSFGLPNFIRIGARPLTECWRLLEMIAEVQKEQTPADYEPISPGKLLEAIEEVQKEADDTKE